MTEFQRCSGCREGCTPATRCKESAKIFVELNGPGYSGEDYGHNRDPHAIATALQQHHGDSPDMQRAREQAQEYLDQLPIE
jgi:hypothetical protein